MEKMKQDIDEALRRLEGQEQKILVVGCEYSVDVTEIDRPNAAPVRLPCAGMMPPSAMDYALRGLGADGVLVTGCDCADCQFRLGNLWTDERIQKKRPPYLSGRADRARIRTLWTKLPGRNKVLREFDALAEDLKGRPAEASGSEGVGGTAQEADDEQR